MNLEETKTSFLGLSLKAILIIGGILSASGTTLYVGITTYNRVIAATESIEAYKPYDDNDLKRSILEKNAALEQENARLRAEVDTAKTALLQASTQLARVQEKASEAAVASTEAKTIALGTQRETQAMLSSIREEIKSTREGLEARMKALQKATVNPLGN
jgi:predicted  nucleic acid-binding Zn-ribbon protein